jgi:ribosomal protein S18 acetylase RimI-like enzyme
MSTDARSGSLPLIRKVIPKDIKEILEAQFFTFPNDPANLDEEEFTRAISAKITEFWLLPTRRFAGYVIVHNRPYRPWSNLNSLIVLPRYSRKGVGRRLLDEAMKPLHRRPILRLFVESNNSRAIQLYRKAGFVHMQTKKL